MNNIKNIKKINFFGDEVQDCKVFQMDNGAIEILYGGDEEARNSKNQTRRICGHIMSNTDRSSIEHWMKSAKEEGFEGVIPDDHIFCSDANINYIEIRDDAIIIS